MTSTAIVSTLMDVSWRAVMIAALAGAALLLWRGRSGTARHAVWTGVVVSMLSMPTMLSLVPAWSIDVPIRVPALIEPALLEPPGPTPAPAPLKSDAPGQVRPVEVDMAPLVRVPNPSTGAQRTELPPIPWMDITVVVWLLGVAFQLVVMAHGWRWSSRLAASARRTNLEGVVESDAVVAPCAVGLWRGRILVPAAWRSWKAHVRQAVLFHERAHLRRHDPLTACIARLNRAVFWFHPLAWWLERRIAAAAEHACDEAVLRGGSDPRRYASLLVEIAATVSHRGTRVAWHQVGMAGGRRLERRVDRILSTAPSNMGVSRTIALGLTCVAAVTFVIGCRPSPSVSTMELEPDPEVATQIERNERWRVDTAAVAKMTVADVEHLSRGFRENPDDLDTAGRLLLYFQSRGHRELGWARMIEIRRPVLLSLIDRHPASDRANWFGPRAHDPEGFDGAVRLWNAHLASPDVEARVYWKAVRFVARQDPERAERLYLDAISKFPRPAERQPPLGPGWVPNWTMELGQFYARAVVGCLDDAAGCSPDPVQAQTAFAARARALLDSSTDVVMLEAAALYLRRQVGRPRAGLTPGLDASRLALDYFKRVQALDPRNRAARYWLDYENRERAQRELFDHVKTVFGADLTGLTLEQVRTLAADRQVALLPMLAAQRYRQGEYIGQHDKDEAKRHELIAQARELADAALVLLATQSDSRDVYADRESMHLVRGAVALAQGDRSLAVRHLLLAADVVEKAGETFDHWQYNYAQQILTTYLLKAGELDAVTTYFDRMAPYAPKGDTTYADGAKAIREGRMPRQYQWSLRAQ